ncbi:MAG: hypothetical protein IE916_04130 [Epsilonproteobacteria bacterium]|nr:hypothetical protein [Campylobacterota bacterium]
MSKKEKTNWVTDIILVDVIGFSKISSDEQHEIISFLTLSYKKMIEKLLVNSNMPLSRLILGFVPTGDGFFCILNPRLKGYGTILGLSFNHFSEYIAKKFPYFQGVKIAVHTGSVYEFTDILGHRNYIGDGLNDCARYIEHKEFNLSTVMVSTVAFESLKRFLELYKDFQILLAEREFKYSSLQTFYDKHGQQKQGYLVWLRKDGIINPPDINFNSILTN